jgi:hypothetical protein
MVRICLVSLTIQLTWHIFDCRLRRGAEVEVHRLGSRCRRYTERDRIKEREREREMTNTPRICTTVKNRIIAVGLVLHHVGKASMRARVVQEFKFLSIRPQKLSLCNSFAGMWPGRPFLWLQRPSPPPDPFMQGYLRLVFFTISSPGQPGRDRRISIWSLRLLRPSERPSGSGRLRGDHHRY